MQELPAVELALSLSLCLYSVGAVAVGCMCVCGVGELDGVGGGDLRAPGTPILQDEKQPRQLTAGVWAPS